MTPTPAISLSVKEVSLCTYIYMNNMKRNVPNAFNFIYKNILRLTYQQLSIQM